MEPFVQMKSLVRKLSNRWEIEAIMFEAGVKGQGSGAPPITSHPCVVSGEILQILRIGLDDL